MEKLYLLLFLFFTSCLWLKGQDSIASTRLQFSFIPQLGSISNGANGGNGKSGLGYEIEAGMTHQLSQKMGLETGVQLQRANIKQRSNNLQWPSDVENGAWVPGRSYEQLEVNYLSAGLSLGFNLKLTSKKDNQFSFQWSGMLKKVIDFEDNLVINESGHITHDGDIDLDNEVNKFQILLGLGFSYDMVRNHKKTFSIGPSFEYSVKDLLSSSEPTLLWTYEGGHPFFLGLKITYNL